MDIQPVKFYSIPRLCLSELNLGKNISLKKTEISCSSSITGYLCSFSIALCTMT